jgi:hypothetical protein
MIQLGGYLMKHAAFLVTLFIACGIVLAQSAPPPSQPPSQPPLQPPPQSPAQQAPLYYYPTQSPNPPWQYEINFSGGYSNVIFNHTGGQNYSHDGGYIDFGADFNLPGTRPIVLGLDVTATGTFNNYNENFQNLYSEMTFVTLEGRAELPLFFHPDRGFFVTPRIGAGPMLTDFYGQLPFNTYYQHTGPGFEIRPGVKIGYRFLPGGTASLGLDASYMFAWGDFGDFGSFGQEVRVGAFFTWRF